MASRLEQFRAAVSRHPESELFRFSLAQALVAAEKPAEAIPHLEFCLARRPDWMLATILLGKIQLALGQVDRARPALEAGLRLALEQHHDDPAAEMRELLGKIPVSS